MKNRELLQEERDPMIYSSSIKEKYQPDHFFLKSPTGLIAILLIVIIDSAVLMDFVTANRIAVNFSFTGLVGFGIIAAYLLVLNVLLPIAFIAIKRNRYGVDNTPSLLIASCFGIVVIFVVCMLAVRWSLVTPDTLASGSRTYAQAIMFSLLPVGTAMASSLLLFSAYNPLLKKMCFFEQQAFSEGEKLREAQAELAKYEADEGDYLSRLITEEEGRYNQKFEQITAMSPHLKTYFRRKLSSILADPRSATILCADKPEPYQGDVKRVTLQDLMKDMNSKKKKDFTMDMNPKKEDFTNEENVA